jgi:hypothetical protein
VGSQNIEIVRRGFEAMSKHESEIAARGDVLKSRAVAKREQQQRPAADSRSGAG